MNRLLAVHPGGICEQLLFLPTLQTLLSQDYRIDVVVPPDTRGVYRLSSVADKVIPFKFESSIGLADWSNLFGIIREREHDVVLSTRQDTSLRFFLWLLGIPRRISFDAGRGTFMSGAFMMSEVVPKPDQTDAIATYGSLLMPLGLTLTSSQYQLHVPTTDQAWFNAHQASLGLNPDQPTVVLHDSGEGTTPNYAIDNWRAVVAGIRDRIPEAQTVLLQYGGNEAWISACQSAEIALPVIAAKTVEQAAAAIASARWLIATDQVPLFLGAGCSAAVIGLFGSTPPEQRLPMRDSCLGLHTASGQVNDIPPIQILEQLT